MTTSLNVLLIDDEPIVHQTLGDYLRESDHYVVSSQSAAEGLNILQTGGFDLVISDVRMPGMDGLGLLQRLGEQYPDLSVVIMTGHGNMEMAVQALRLGAADFLTKPIKLLELDAVLERSIRLRTLQKENNTLHATVDHLKLDGNRENEHILIGESDHVKRVREQILQVVQTDCDTVMVTGETGTGKEVIAREIHRQLDGGERPFIAVSCPTIPANLVESELFGAAKGSYTGATEDRQGLFELAHTGILFLDEISDLSPSAQAAMLRVLETRRIRPVGGAREVAVNVRVIAASNTPLE
ncbi:MAG: sigma-54-dependent Fis family transcriptional regulator, partial [Candidatus Latescibacteria bacterium]|nr:sigma-54-dependent Fis family transcriptional regulator [Candidatus Latescibacterota bacterium]